MFDIFNLRPIKNVIQVLTNSNEIITQAVFKQAHLMEQNLAFTSYSTSKKQPNYQYVYVANRNKLIHFL